MNLDKSQNAIIILNDFNSIGYFPIQKITSVDYQYFTKLRYK